MNVNNIPVGYRRDRDDGEPCSNKGCTSKENKFHHSLYAKKKKGKLMWICFRCAKNVDKII